MHFAPRGDRSGQPLGAFQARPFLSPTRETQPCICTRPDMAKPLEAVLQDDEADYVLTCSWPPPADVGKEGSYPVDLSDEGFSAAIHGAAPGNARARLPSWRR